ncbi:MAG: hypothetical protein GY725_04935 [bacterium]|nr:hypothetical protein [bacterium]
MNYDEDHLAELANISAGHVATVLARLLDKTLLMDPPQVRLIPPDSGPLDSMSDEERAAVVYADLVGVYPGQAALVLPEHAIVAIVERLVGKTLEDEELDDRARSALCEMGNIAISAAANALGEIEGGIVIPSLPRLELVAETVPALTGRPGTEASYVAEVELFEPQGEMRLLFLWIPSD